MRAPASALAILLASTLAGSAADGAASPAPGAGSAAAPAAAPASLEGLLPWDLKTRAPAADAALRAAIPDTAPDERWARGLSGVAGPLKLVEVDGHTYLSGSVCKPQDCRANRIVFLVAPDGSRAATEVRFGGEGAPRREVSGGEAGPDERAWLMDRLDQ